MIKKFSKIIIKITIISLAIFSFITLKTVEAAPKKANIIIVATGGTIDGIAKSSSNSAYSPSQLMVAELIKNIPDLEKIANITSLQFSQINSQDMNNDLWLKLAKTINRLAAKRAIDGIVITHGTDTMEETAYFLNLVVKSKKPIILVGSMRPANSLSSDGSLNLYNAVALAANPAAKNKGVMIVFNDNIFAARDATKTNTTNVDSFQSNNSGAIGHIYYGQAQFYYNPIRLNTINSVFDVRDLETLPKVDIIYGYANHSKIVIDDLVNDGAQGLVLAGVGDGNIYQDSLQSLINASAKGIAVVRSSRVGSGFVAPNVEIDDDKYKFITADNLNPQKARILLMLALTKTTNPKKIQQYFWQY